MIDPVAAAIDAVAAYFDAVHGIASAIRGWPEHGVELDLSAGPVVSVTRAGEPQREQVPPTEVDRTDLGGGSLEVLYRVAFLEFDLQLDLWAAYRATRDDGALVVEGALHNRLPIKSGLELSSSGYYDRPLTITASSGIPVDDDEGVSVGEWRQRWMLRCRSDLVIPHIGPAQSTITLRPTVGPEGLQVTDADTDITP